MKKSHTNLFNSSLTRNQTRQKQVPLTMQQKLNNVSLTQSIRVCEVKLPIEKYQKQIKSLQTQTNSKHSLDATQILLKQTSLKLQQSENIMKQFYQTRKSLIIGKENSNNSSLNKELTMTKQRLRKRQYGLNLLNQQKSNKSKSKDHPTNEKSHINMLKQKLNQNEYKNLDLNKKINLIKYVIDQQTFKETRREIQNKVQMLKKKYHSEPQLRQKIIKYYTSYEILGIFLQELSKDPSKLALKQLNIQTYYLIKQQMIGLVSNQQHFNSHIEQLLKKQTLRQNSLIPKTLQKQQKFLKLHNLQQEYNSKVRQKPSSNKRQKLFDSVGCQQLSRIQQLLIEAKQDIKEAFKQFGKVENTFQIELQFSNRRKGSFNQVNSSNMLLINCGLNQTTINCTKLA